MDIEHIKTLFMAKKCLVILKPVCIIEVRKLETG